LQLLSDNLYLKWLALEAVRNSSACYVLCANFNLGWEKPQPTLGDFNYFIAKGNAINNLDVWV
jgi:hypothetical protein